MSSVQAVNQLLDYIMDRVAAALPGKGGKNEKLIRQFNEEANKVVCEEFIREPEVSALYVYFEGAEKLTCSLTPDVKKKGLFLLKSKNVQDVLKL